MWLSQNILGELLSDQSPQHWERCSCATTYACGRNDFFPRAQCLEFGHDLVSHDVQQKIPQSLLLLVIHRSIVTVSFPFRVIHKDPLHKFVASLFRVHQQVLHLGFITRHQTSEKHVPCDLVAWHKKSRRHIHQIRVLMVDLILGILERLQDWTHRPPTENARGNEEEQSATPHVTKQFHELCNQLQRTSNPHTAC